MKVETMMIPTDPEMRRILEEAHAERSAMVRQFLASLFSRRFRAPQGAQPVAA